MDSLLAAQKSWRVFGGHYVDAPALGAGQDGQYLRWNNGEGAIETGIPTAADVGAYTIANADAAIAAAVATHAALTATHGVSGAIVGTTDTQTLANKTLTLPIISQISNTGTLTLPTSTDTLVGRATADTLANKTLTTPTIGDFSNATHTHQNAAGGGQLDHGLALTGLGDDDHTQYLLATGARTGASSQAQTFTNGIKSGKIIAISDSTNALGLYRANGATQDVWYDSTNGVFGVGAIPTTAQRLRVYRSADFPSGASKMIDVSSIGSGHSDGTSSNIALSFLAQATGANDISSLAAIQGDSYCSMASGTLASITTMSASIRVVSGGNLTSAYGYRTIPILTSTGAVSTYKAFDVRQPVISGAGGIGTSYGLHIENQAVSGVSTAYAIYTNSGDIRLMASNSDKIGFHGETPVARQLLATGAGATVDQVIAALQNLGLLRQS